MTTTTDAPPANPEAAALDLIVRIAEAVPGATALRAVLQEFAGALQIEGALAGLATITDARIAAATIAEAVCTAEDPVGALRIRAAVLRAGCGGPAAGLFLQTQGKGADVEPLAQALDAAASVWNVL